MSGLETGVVSTYVQPVAVLRLGVLDLDALVAHGLLRYLLSVGSTVRKTFGKMASGKQITDDLIDVLARRAEAGYEIEELTEPMDIAEAKARLDVVLDEFAAAGFSVWGWDDGSIQIGQLNGPNAECSPRYAVDDPRSR